MEIDDLDITQDTAVALTAGTYPPRQLVRLVLTLTGGVVPDTAYASEIDNVDGSADWLVVATVGKALIRVTGQAETNDVEAELKDVVASVGTIQQTVQRVRVTAIDQPRKWRHEVPPTSPWFVTGWLVEMATEDELAFPRQGDSDDAIERAEAVALAIIGDMKS